MGAGTVSDRNETAMLLARLERHYIKPGEQFPGGIFVPECGRNGSTGGRADALYVGFTSTSGRLLIGHELKVSRADWRTELAKPGKADAWADECHAWYVVAPSTAVVPPEELPAGWGLLTINPRSTTRLAVTVKAAIHRDRNPSWDAVRSIMARQDTLRAGAIERARAKALDDARARVQTEQARSADRRLTAQEQARLNLLDQLEDLIGYRLDLFDFEDPNVSPARLAAAIALCRAAEEVGHALPRYQGEQLARTLDKVREGYAELGKALDGWHAVGPQR